jgi:hypothetical protein
MSVIAESRMVAAPAGAAWVLSGARHVATTHSCPRLEAGLAHALSTWGRSQHRSGGGSSRRCDPDFRRLVISANANAIAHEERLLTNGN